MPAAEAIEIRMDRKTDRSAGPAACWPWTGARHAAGYGWVNFRGRSALAHRVAFELAHGPVPDGLQVDHLCRNRICVNPGHLEAVTQAENMRRSEGASAQAARRTHCPNGHPYEGDNLYVLPSTGQRQCRTCGRNRARAERAEHREYINARKRAAYARQRAREAQR